MKSPEAFSQLRTTVSQQRKKKSCVKASFRRMLGQSITQENVSTPSEKMLALAKLGLLRIVA
jgi:hypothetical protein